VIFEKKAQKFIKMIFPVQDKKKKRAELADILKLIII